MRKFGWVGVLVAIIGMSIYVGTPVVGQQPQRDQVLDAATARHHRVRRKAGRLQGTADAVGRSRSAGRVVERRHARRRHGRASGRSAAAALDAVAARRRTRRRRGSGCSGTAGCGGTRWSSAAVPRRRGAEGSSGSDHGRGQEKRRCDD